MLLSYQGELERATFSSQNVLLANDRVTALMHQLPVSSFLREEETVYRSASDGQKYTLALDSIHANYSAKYFGKDKGITIYRFISETYPVFYTNVFSSGDYEAWYVLDGLLHNASTMPQKQTHSTDTHGVTDLNFAVTYLLGMAFELRIKDFHLATLYGMPGLPIQPQEGYAFKTGGLNQSRSDRQPVGYYPTLFSHHQTKSRAAFNAAKKAHFLRQPPSALPGPA